VNVGLDTSNFGGPLPTTMYAEAAPANSLVEITTRTLQGRLCDVFGFCLRARNEGR
jgi:hypothetical protein